MGRARGRGLSSDLRVSALDGREAVGGGGGGGEGGAGVGTVE